MQVQSRALSCPDHNSTHLRSTRVHSPLLSGEITADYNLNHSGSTLKQLIPELLQLWSLITLSIGYFLVQQESRTSQ